MTLIINGITVPEPAHKGITYSKNKVWSADTGRASSGIMQGTLLGVKSKIEITWPPLTEAQIAVIQSAVNGSFVPVTYTDVDGKDVTETMYFGDVSYSKYSDADGLRYYTDVKVDGIQA